MKTDLVATCTCGGTGKLAIIIDVSPPATRQYSFGCTKCEYRTPWLPTLSEAVEEWDSQEGNEIYHPLFEDVERKEQDDRPTTNS